jgi:hypothetical protein
VDASRRPVSRGARPRSRRSRRTEVEAVRDPRILLRIDGKLYVRWTP